MPGEQDRVALARGLGERSAGRTGEAHAVVAEQGGGRQRFALLPEHGLGEAGGKQVGCESACVARVAGAHPEHCSLYLDLVEIELAEQQVEPNLRAAQAMDWALQKRWIGIDDEGRAMLAAAMLANARRQAPST